MRANYSNSLESMNPNHDLRPRIDVYSMRLFMAVAQAGSIARAAQAEHIAASALSRRLGDLEHALGAALLERSPRGVVLTAVGQKVYEYGQQLDAVLVRMTQEVWSAAGAVKGVVRLFANASAIVGELPERLQQFHQQYPDVDVALQEWRSWEVVRACLDDQADLGIAVAAEVPRGLESWHFAFDPLVVLMPAAHSLAHNKGLKLADISKLGIVGIQPGGALDQLIKHQADAQQLALQFKVSVNSFDAACRMVQAGMGLAVIPLSATQAYASDKGFAIVPLREGWAKRELRLYALKKSPRMPAVQRLIEALAKQA